MSLNPNAVFEATELFHKIKPHEQAVKERISGLILESILLKSFPDLFTKSTNEQNLKFIDAFANGIPLDFKCSTNRPNISLSKDVHFNLCKSSTLKLLPCYKSDNYEFTLLGVLSSLDFHNKNISVERKNTPRDYFYVVPNSEIERYRIDVEGLVDLDI